jgi:hypothetical protein
MSGDRSMPSRGLFLAFLAVVLVLWGSAGCSYLHGTIALASQLDPHVQLGATRIMGYGDTHVGILSDADALKELSRVLEATTAAGKP